MLVAIQAGILRNPYTSSQNIRTVIKRAIDDVIAAIVGITGFVRVLPHTLRISMAPKITRKSGDKLDGSKMIRVGRDKGDLAGVNRCPTGKPTGKNMYGLGKEVKTSDSVAPLVEVRGKSKSQFTIMSFLAGGGQESCPAHITLPSESNPMVVETIPSDTCSEITLMEGNGPHIEAIQGREDLAGIGDSSTVISEKEWGPLTEKEQLQVQPQGQRSEHPTRVGATSISSPTVGTEEMQDTKRVE
ncbi:hypothetical protein NDU88_005505 [Pleurodeles waltl]|uniref:Uncharacterized protein n=1 Tax=Pleurodeles waltl TaxID=8319 RepID=A0AAV7N1H2_PLEWA|nr:hypothetical protein NDU88_005505 [Pleurodeles waltl]